MYLRQVDKELVASAIPVAIVLAVGLHRGDNVPAVVAAASAEVVAIGRYVDAFDQSRHDGAGQIEILPRHLEVERGIGDVTYDGGRPDDPVLVLLPPAFFPLLLLPFVFVSWIVGVFSGSS